MQGVKIADIILKSFTAGYLPEIRKLNFQSDCSSRSFGMFKPFHKFLFEFIQLCYNFETGHKIFLISKFCAHRFTLLIWFNRTLIDTSYNIIEEYSCFSKIPYKRYPVPFLQIRPFMNSKYMHLLCSHFSDSVKFFNRQLLDELFSFFGTTQKHTIRFIYVRSYLSKKFINRDPGRSSKTSSGSNLIPDFPGNDCSRSYIFFILCDVEKCFIN